MSKDDRATVEAAYRSEIDLEAASEAVFRTIEALDGGHIRIADPDDGWSVNTWVKEAILLYFRLAQITTTYSGDIEYHDKIPTKSNLADQGVRVVPPGTVRYGAFCEPGVIVMPGYVNIGAYVGAGSMVDTWATVGSCAQIGSDVHLSGGVGIGGVLEPPGARPVIVEDGAFIGSRSIVVEGAHIGAGAVLGANTTITSSTPIIDVTGPEPIEMRGAVPAGAVVVPGTRPKEFPAGSFELQCALIIGSRSASTDRKTSLEDALRNFEVQV
ncbi:MAG: 2,3,4,5-tetrahydropyridine-2,6-dicarboxylate N-succinyltransferase [Acidimicrobiia bacterium]